MVELTFAALIPAAGLSSRMKAYKPLAELGGRTLVEHVVSLFEGAGIADIVTVVGHRHDELIRVLDRTVSHWIYNPDYREGMFTSVQRGLMELQGRCDAFFVLPVDIPLVRAITIRRIMERFSDRSALICHPAFEFRCGHPPLIDSSLIEELLTWKGTGGLKAFLDGYADRSVQVPVADAWIRRDLDTDEELAALRRDFERYTIPTLQECDVMLDHYFKVPEGVKAHSRAVARVAACLGEALNAAGGRCDLDLLTVSGLIHDAFKGEKDHAGRGAAWLERNGFPEVAKIVAEHVDILWEEGDQVDERALVYLADRVVEEESVVTLAQRQAGALAKYGHDETVRRNIEARFETAEKIQSAVEKTTGLSLIRILGSSGK
jgi:CTP:molybdopterin cytidylyltransferase MocA